MHYFFANICTDEWNIEQDKGRLLSEATEILQKQFPDYHHEIAMFYGQWEQMLKGEILETVQILHQLKKTYKLYGLTNWSAETIQIAYDRFSFFAEFDGIVVSGVEKLIKPDHRIYQLLFDRYNVKPEESIFIDDNEKNIIAARALGLHAIHFNSPSQLKSELEIIGII